MLRKHGMEGRDGEKWSGEDESHELACSFTISMLDRLHTKWMCNPQGLGPLLSNGDKGQRK